jgi:hypothetical protein
MQRSMVHAGTERWLIAAAHVCARLAYSAGESSDHFVVGDLDADGAAAYYAHLQPRWSAEERARLPPFAHIHAAVGGRMADISLATRQLARDHVRHVDHLPALLWEEELLRRALYPAALAAPSGATPVATERRRAMLTRPPAWQPDHARTLFQRLAADGRVGMDDALHVVGGDWTALRSLIDYHAVLYRPSPALSDDLGARSDTATSSAPPARAEAMLVPRSPLSRYAMQRAPFL